MEKKKNTREVYCKLSPPLQNLYTYIYPQKCGIYSVRYMEYQNVITAS